MPTITRRSGNTLIEVVVATLLLAGGALAMLQATLRTQQLRSRLLARRDARLAVGDRAAQRRLMPCLTLTNGASRGRGHEATWQVTVAPAHATVRDLVQLDAGGAPLSAAQVVLCDP